VRLLLKSGADVNSRNSKDVFPLDMALHNGRPDVARFLETYMEVIKFESQDPTDVTPSVTALQDFRPEIAQPSVDPRKGMDSPDNGTSLHAASEAGDVETVRLLLERGADVKERDVYHQTAILVASRSGRLQVVKLLIEYGADVNSHDGIGWVPLHVASRNGHLEVVQSLLDHGADVNAKTHDHWTALHFACVIGHAGAEIVEALLNQGANVGVRNDEGRTPSQVASQYGIRKIGRLLSKYDVPGGM
jgi:ankyrin repeat protein